jgi:uroporphyrinogen-III decarboxylase
MTPKDRMSAAMARKRPDRVPVMCQMSIGHMLVQTGTPPPELWFDRTVYAGVLFDLRERYGFDGILISLHGHPADWERRVHRWTRGAAEDVVEWRGGGRTVFPHDDLPRPVPAVESRPISIAGFDPDGLPERPDYIPVSQGLRFSIDPDRPYDILDAVLEKAGGRYSVHGEVTSPFDYFLDLFGFSGGFLALIEEPDRSKEILARFADGVARIAREQADRGVDAIKISSPFAGAGFISPRHYREFVLPFERRVAAAIREKGIFSYTHTCGAVGDRLEMIGETGVAGIECLDPPPLGDVELEDALARVGGTLFIKGNIDPVHTLLFGTPEAIAADARGRLAAGAAHGGYILSTACSIAPHTPRRHVEILARSANEFSRGGRIF